MASEVPFVVAVCLRCVFLDDSNARGVLELDEAIRTAAGHSSPPVRAHTDACVPQECLGRREVQRVLPKDPNDAVAPVALGVMGVDPQALPEGTDATIRGVMEAAGVFQGAKLLE